MSAPVPLPFDARPLTEPVDAATARAHVRELRRQGRAPGTNPTTIVVGVVVGVLFLTVFGTTFAGIAATFFAIVPTLGTSASPVRVLAGVIPAAALILVTVAAVLGVVRLVRRGGAARWYRLDRFARANGMSWYPEAQNPPLPGMIFGLGHSRRATDIVRGERPRLVEFGNYTYKTGSGKNESTHRWGYVAVKLSTPLPHIVLDATGNDSVFGSNLPASFDRDQRLQLEGDFGRHFTLYCPAGYERDALYLFTPDIMARFIDTAAALDVEIVDDWLFLYTPREAATLDPATWAWLFSVVRALIDKLAQWERWRDDRVADAVAAPGAAPGGGAPTGAAGLPFAAPVAALRPPPGVAPQGRRLSRGVPWGVIVAGGVLFTMFLLMQSGVLAMLLR